jgi:conjugative relaxase-like TrwC/TraI family protein
MLSIGKLARGQADYYLEQAKGRVDHAASLETGVDDYYLGGPEAAGYWLGAVAVELDLPRRVSDDGLRRALAGADPSTAGVLVSGGPNRVPGFDLTFSAPKSVSVLFGIGDERLQGAIRSAHDSAVEDALGYLERSAAKGRRGHDGLVTINGSGLLAAAFRHRTSRAGDPQLHTHVVIANLVHGADGRWSALDGRLIYAHAKTAGHLYEARLRAELTRSLGVAWTPVKRGIADVDGVPQPVLRAFSRRRVEIEEELARRGRMGAVAAQVVALATRRRKDYRVTPERLAPEWQERAAAYGFDAAAVERLLGRAKSVPLQREVREAMFDDLATPSGLTERKSTFTRRDVIQAVCERMPTATDISVRGIEQAAGVFLGSPRAIPLAARDAPPQRADVIRRNDGRVVAAVRDEQRYSTPEPLAVEGELISRALAGRRAGAGLARHADVERAIAARPTLSDEQASMVRRVALGGERVVVVVGKAGTGKTFALGAAKEAWEASGHTLVGAAVARRAANELAEGAGMQATSVAALLYELDRGAWLAPKTVVVVDEAGMLATRPLARLLAHVDRAEGKLVLVGDHRQLPELGAGGAFRGLAVRTQAAYLVENRRQREAWEREALEALRQGRATDALAVYGDHGRLVVGKDAERLRERLVTDWWRASQGGAAVMIALRRDDVRDLNGRARLTMRRAGRLGSESIALQGGDFSPGDTIVTKLNHLKAGVVNGERGMVVAVDAVRGTLEADLSGRRVVLTADYLTAETPSGGPSLLHGYAITGHAAQGLTTERAFVLGSDETYREWGYAALSRGAAANHLYVVPDQPERDEFAPQDRRARDPLDSIHRALEGSRAQRMATDIGTPIPVADRRARLVSELADVTGDRDSVKRALVGARSAVETPSPRWWSRGTGHAETDALARRLARLRAEERRLRGELRALDRSEPATRERASQSPDLTRHR